MNNSKFGIFVLVLVVVVLDLSASAVGIAFNLQFEPRQLGKVAVCLIPDRVKIESSLADGGTITNVFNASTTNMTGKVTQTTSARRPSIKLHNVLGGNSLGAGHDSIRFDGSSDQLYVTNLTLNTDISVYLVISNATASAILLEHGPNANSTDGFYVTANSVDSWLAHRTSSHGAAGVANYVLNKFVELDWIYPAASDATILTNGTALSNGSISGSNVGNTTTLNTLQLFGRADNSSLSGGDLWYAIIFTAPHSADDQNRVRWWLKRTFHTP